MHPLYQYSRYTQVLTDRQTIRYLQHPCTVIYVYTVYSTYAAARSACFRHHHSDQNSPPSVLRSANCPPILCL